MICLFNKITDHIPEYKKLMSTSTKRINCHSFQGLEVK